MNKSDLDTLLKELTDMEPDPYEPDRNHKNYRILVSDDQNDRGENRIIVRYGQQYLCFWLLRGYLPDVVPLYTVDIPLAARHDWTLSNVGSTVVPIIRRSMGHAF